MNIVILAAGMGKRMHSKLPKVLQPLAGRPMLDHVLDAVEGFAAVKTVVVGHCAEEVQKHTKAGPTCSSRFRCRSKERGMH